MKFAIPAFFAIAVISSCVGTGADQPVISKESITPELILNQSPLAVDRGAEDFSQVDLLALSPEMIAFLDENVNRNGSPPEKLAQLVLAVIGEDRFLLDYDDLTRTAQDTFRDRRGNCVSFTNMFVAMARELGLKASYQEVTIAPDWSMTGQTYLLSQHVNVLVSPKGVKSRIVDFNFYSNNLINESEVISDQKARAHFFNNIGVEHMLADDTSLAYANFSESLKNDHNFSPAWVNLGILHRREGYPDYAETAYLEALEHDRNNLMAMSNLANLYEQEGRPDLAEFYLGKVQSHRMNNPYYRYQLANSAFVDGDYKTAIDNLEFAIRKRKDEDRFYYLLSLSYLMSGDREAAQRWMQKAEETALKSTNKQKYNHKLDLLMGRDTGI
jgi:Tfp pilus assembly protein PilF